MRCQWNIFKRLRIDAMVKKKVGTFQFKPFISTQRRGEARRGEKEETFAL